MGICYELGHGIECDRDSAYHLYKESAEQGYVPAMENLAFLTMRNGRASKASQQYRESAYWFRRLT